MLAIFRKQGVALVACVLVTWLGLVLGQSTTDKMDASTTGSDGMDVEGTTVTMKMDSSQNTNTASPDNTVTENMDNSTEGEDTATQAEDMVTDATDMATEETDMASNATDDTPEDSSDAVTGVTHPTVEDGETGNTTTESPYSEATAETEASDNDNTNDTVTDADNTGDKTAATAETHTDKDDGVTEADKGNNPDDGSDETDVTTAEPMESFSCYHCEGAGCETEREDSAMTCTGSLGICFMTYDLNNSSKPVTRSCNSTVQFRSACEEVHPSGQHANGVCEFCCKTKLCNSVVLTSTACEQIRNAANIACYDVTVYVTILAATTLVGHLWN